jgi:ketosteroid isomerase-like protein
MIVEDYFAAVEALDEAALARLLHPDVVITEQPNAVNPHGTVRDRAEALAALRRAGEILEDQRFEIQDQLLAGDRVALKATWHGRLADGRELSAHVAAFLQIRDARIYRHETYDCYATSLSF